MKALRMLLITVLFAMGFMSACVWLGIYNVAATEPHWNLTHWLLDQVRDRSIATHSRGIAVPPLDDPKFESQGFHHYHAMCRLCHGAPGHERIELARGLYPNPPDLASGDVQRKWTEGQLYWIIKNGLKMTGMPAFGSTHDEDELWGMALFVKRLPGMSAKEYVERIKAAETHHDENTSHHSHDDGHK